MNPTRNGKIARLPQRIREQLNLRLQDGEQGRKLVAWLNSVPEVRAVVTADFSGRPVREQNLSEWKCGGYRDWLALQEARELTARLDEETADLEDNAPSQPLTEKLSHWLAVRYAVATRDVMAAEGPERWRALREMCGDIVELRKGDHSARRLELERIRVAAAERDADMRWKRKIVIGLESLLAELGQNPEAREAFDRLSAILRHPFDPSESAPDGEQASAVLASSEHVPAPLSVRVS